MHEKEWRRIMAVRKRMSPAERAKQFMPFAALKGFEDALREKEKIVVERISLSEESKEELDRKLREIRRNDMITVIYYLNDEYVKVTGMVARLDMDARILKVVNTKIPFDDIYDIQFMSHSFGMHENGIL